ncbi:MAG: 3'(2'),5'-bisphosphate nucleotidase CysQ [Caldilinea sp.]|uniref:3'(2'),5'-bisphosphate nucleotidase CysQ family protein n=1 Tax=Caldilinea sp. TaxID=2293560 RepID=UPI002C81BEC9|nr:3'(2'),5'-bisphosphate nucleotidase CysQ [Anaerolineales bacterium]HQY90752.1 3'(2'),5'-bisphosphate nucleotidase CysQ [Caldilinea sp.]
MAEQQIKTLDLTQELEFVSKLAREAATIVNTFYIGSSEVRYKPGDEPVTEADRSANQHIVERIRARFPEDGLLSEESKDDLARLDNSRVWIVDPLDGTKEFIARNGEFSIMIGLVVEGRAVLGVVQQPATSLLYAGAAGHGAYLYEDGERIRLTASNFADIRNMTMVSSRSHRQQIVDRIRAQLNITRERVSGSAGLKVGLITRQLADLYIHPSPGCKEWDLCAPQALLEAAGGRMTDCWGNPLRYNKRDVRAHNGIIATNGAVHDQVVEVVASICEEFGYNQDDGFW